MYRVITYSSSPQSVPYLSGGFRYLSHNIQLTPELTIIISITFTSRRVFCLWLSTCKCGHHECIM